MPRKQLYLKFKTPYYVAEENGRKHTYKYVKKALGYYKYELMN